MLKKQERLTTAEFNHYFKQGKRHHSPHLQLVYTPANTFKAIVVVGKKVSKLAVRRNRLRRQLYNTVRELHITKQLSGVFLVMVKPKAKDCAADTLRAECVELIQTIANQ